MRKDTVESILLLMGLIAPACAFIVFWVGKLLNLRKEIIELQMNAGFDRQKIESLEERMDKMEDWYNGRRNN